MSILQIYPGTGSPVGGPAPIGRKSSAAVPVSASQRYDQAEFSSHLDQTEKRIKETVAQLSQEIRCRVTTQDIENLRQQVAEGTYQPNPREIAARMLLLREEDGTI